MPNSISRKLFFSGTLVFALVIMIGFAIWRFYSFKPYQDPIKSGVTIINEFNTTSFRVNPSAELPRLQAQLTDEGTDLSQYSKHIIISPHDESVGHLPFATYTPEEEVFSGFQYVVNEANKAVVISIFLNPDTEERLVLNAINYNYVTALLFIEKTILYQDDPPPDTFSTLATQADEFYNSIAPENRPLMQ